LGILGGSGNNRSSRLYAALVERGLAVDASSSYRATIDADLFTFFVTLSPGIGHSEVEEAVWSEIRRIQQDGVTAQELAKAIKQTRAQFAYSSESVTYQAYWLGFAEVVASLDWLEGWQDALVAVTSSEVQRVARTYFERDRQTVGWYVPDGSAMAGVGYGDETGDDEFDYEEPDMDGES
jgi:zinc protease